MQYDRCELNYSIGKKKKHRPDIHQKKSIDWVTVGLWILLITVIVLFVFT